MEYPPTIENVCQAIYTLYHDPDTSGKEKASHFLDELQRSVYGWKIADELLHHKSDLETCYFAAQTMKVKIQYSFHELPAESHTSLRDSLINHIGRVREETNSVIVTQLCLALSHLALQMSSWENPIDDIITRFGMNAQNVPALLEVLTVLPEELTSRNLRLGANRRSEVVQILVENSPRVILLCHSCVQSFGDTECVILRRVYRCLGSWFSVKALPSSDPTLLSLIGYGFQILGKPNTDATMHEAVSDAICCSLILAEETSKHQVLAEVLFQGVYSLVEPYHSAVAQEDIDKVVNICRIFTELCESLLHHIVDYPNVGLGNLQNLDLLLICVGHHDFEVAEVTFNFWYRLSEMLYKRDNNSLNKIFEPYVQRLITALCRHCQLEQDHEGVPEETDDFAEFRSRVQDLIKDVVFVIGSSKCFQQMFDNLKNQGSAATWDITEASLFVMGAVAKSVIPEESSIVPQVVEAILNLPETSHLAVQYTSIQLLGELSEWIEKHPQYLDPVLNFILKCLQQPTLSSISASSLKNICSTCTKQMQPHFTMLLNILQALDTFSLSNKATEGLLKGTALILGEMPFDQLTNGLREICQTQLRPLSELLKSDAGAPKEGTKNDPAVWLDRLAAIFRYTTPQVVNGEIHPCQPVVKEVWPLLSETCNKYQGDTRIIERCCRCIRFVIRCVGKQSALLLEPLVKQMVELYQRHQHSCFLYLGSILVDEYGSEPGCVQGLLDMLQAFCGPTFKLLEQPNGLRNNPGTVDDLFRLCARFLQWAPVPFLQSPAVKPVLQCAILACSLDHKDANTSVMKFFQDLISGSRLNQQNGDDTHQKQALVKQIILEYGQDLTNSLIHASLFCLPSYVLVNVASVLYEITNLDKDSMRKWLECSLHHLPTRNSGGSVTATNDQLQDFHTAVISAQHVKNVSIALREFARLYR